MALLKFASQKQLTILIEILGLIQDIIRRGNNIRGGQRSSVRKPASPLLI